MSNKKTACTKEQFLTLIASTEIERADIQLLDNPVYVKAINAAERDAFEASCMAGKGKNRGVNMENVRARLLVLALCDENGTRLFGNQEAELLGTVPALIIDKLFSIAQRLGGLSPADVEEIAGNS